MQGRLDVRHRAADIQQRAVGMGAADRQAVGLRKGDDRLVILFRRAEPGGELFRGQVMPVVGMGRIVELRQESGERLRVAQRQADGQVQPVAAASRPIGCNCPSTAGT